MQLKKLLLSASLVAVASMAFAQGGNPPQQPAGYGTKAPLYTGDRNTYNIGDDVNRALAKALYTPKAHLLMWTGPFKYTPAGNTTPANYVEKLQRVDARGDLEAYEAGVDFVVYQTVGTEMPYFVTPSPEGTHDVSIDRRYLFPLIQNDGALVVASYNYQDPNLAQYVTDLEAKLKMKWEWTLPTDRDAANFTNPLANTVDFGKIDAGANTEEMLKQVTIKGIDGVVLFPNPDPQQPAPKRADHVVSIALGHKFPVPARNMTNPYAHGLVVAAQEQWNTEQPNQHPLHECVTGLNQSSPIYQTRFMVVPVGQPTVGFQASADAAQTGERKVTHSTIFTGGTAFDNMEYKLQSVSAQIPVVKDIAQKTIEAGKFYQLDSSTQWFSASECVRPAAAGTAGKWTAAAPMNVQLYSFEKNLPASVARKYAFKIVYLKVTKTVTGGTETFTLDEAHLIKDFSLTAKAEFVNKTGVTGRNTPPSYAGEYRTTEFNTVDATVPAAMPQDAEYVDYMVILLPAAEVQSVYNPALPGGVVSEFSQYGDFMAQLTAPNKARGYHFATGIQESPVGVNEDILTFSSTHGDMALGYRYRVINMNDGAGNAKIGTGAIYYVPFELYNKE